MRLEIDIHDRVFQYAKQYIKQKSKYSPEVFKNAPTESKVFPLVIIPQCKIILNDETLKTPSKNERGYKIIFDTEIYATDKTVGTKKTSKQTIISELEELLYEVFEEHFGLLGKEPQMRPNADINVAREGIEFTGKYKNKIFYRR